jgi:hypothetical protein
MTQKCHALVVGLFPYDRIFKTLQDGLKLDFDRKEIKYTFTYDFIGMVSEAMERARNVQHDIYFIDGSFDGNAGGQVTLSRALKNLYPNVPVIGVSAESRFLVHEHHDFDDTVHITYLKEKLHEILSRYGFQ